MPRKPRIYLPGVPCHIVQRGINRAACFFTGEDYQFYLDCLKDAADRYEVAIHAYVLMTNHVHLLVTPSTSDGISRLMQLLGNRYVQYINKRYCRSGTLWEGRHKSSLVDAESYLITCYRYIEQNPVRAGMTEHPGDYRWSSYRYHALGEPDPIITDHGLYLAIDVTPEMRQHYYRELFRTELDTRDVHDIRSTSALSKPLGNDRFRQEIEQVLEGLPMNDTNQYIIREDVAVYY